MADIRLKFKKNRPPITTGLASLPWIPTDICADLIVDNIAEVIMIDDENILLRRMAG